MNTELENTDLLSVARSVLKDDLLEEIPAAKKYQALMIANAMAISARELEQGKMGPFSPEFLEYIKHLVDVDGTDEGVVDALIKRIRNQSFDAGSNQSTELHRALLKETRRKVEISNPRYLE